MAKSRIKDEDFSGCFFDINSGIIPNHVKSIQVEWLVGEEQP